MKLSGDFEFVNRDTFGLLIRDGDPIFFVGDDLNPNTTRVSRANNRMYRFSHDTELESQTFIISCYGASVTNPSYKIRWILSIERALMTPGASMAAEDVLPSSGEIPPRSFGISSLTLDVQIKFEPGNPPRWNMRETCEICDRPLFKFVRPRHHCRSCGRTVCEDHSEHLIPMPHLGILDVVRCCDICHKQLSPSLLSVIMRMMDIKARELDRHGDGDGEANENDQEDDDRTDDDGRSVLSLQPQTDVQPTAISISSITLAGQDGSGPVRRRVRAWRERRRVRTVLHQISQTNMKAEVAAANPNMSLHFNSDPSQTPDVNDSDTDDEGGDVISQPLVSNNQSSAEEKDVNEEEEEEEEESSEEEAEKDVDNTKEEEEEEIAVHALEVSKTKPEEDEDHKKSDSVKVGCCSSKCIIS